MENTIDSSAGTHIRQILANLDLMSLKFRLYTKDKVILGPDDMKGDIWRGGFGEALKSLACIRRLEGTDCHHCDSKEECFFFVHFASDRPHSYVMRPSLDSKKIYNRGETIQLDIVLIGEIVKEGDKFLRTIEELGRIGIGKGKGRFYVKDISAGSKINIEKFFDEELDLSEKLFLELLTPLKIREKGSGLYYNGITFETFFKFLIKRMINLNTLYCNGMRYYDKEIAEEEKQKLLSLSKSVKARVYINWEDYERFSSRQQRSIKIGGQAGIIILEGNLSPFYPYLKIGEITGVGHHTTSGFGRYRVRENFEVN